MLRIHKVSSKMDWKSWKNTTSKFYKMFKYAIFWVKFYKFYIKSILNGNESLRLYSNTFQSFKITDYCLILNCKSKNWVTLKKYAKFEKIEKFKKSLNLLKNWLNIHSEDEIKASEEFKEKHPTHRGLPVGNQVDGLPPELRGSDKTAFSRGQRVLVFFAIGNWLSILKY